MIVKVCEKHEVELWAGEECEICALRTRVAELERKLSAHPLHRYTHEQVSASNWICPECASRDVISIGEEYICRTCWLLTENESAESRVEALQKALRGLWQMVNRYNRTTSCVDCCKEYNAGGWKNHSDNCPMRAARDALAPDAEKEG